MIGLSIPLSLFFAVITLHLLGRTLNVVSLAGLAFSTGIVIDAALIAQGNVLHYVRLRSPADEGYARGTASHAGVARLDADQRRDLPAYLVHGGSRGQLFKDLAITMSVSHAASLLVAMTLIPAANRCGLPAGIPADQHQHWWTAMTAFAMRLTDTPRARWAWIGGLTAARRRRFCCSPRAWTTFRSRRPI